jgi:sulfate transport system substrate-binding protein
MRARGLGLITGALAIAVALAGCGSSGSSKAAGSNSDPAGSGKALPAAQLALVAYSTPQAAFEKIIAAFQKTPQGKNITFSQSYGASGTQSRAVAAGQTADIVDFSLAPDMDRLVKANIVAPTWNENPYHGFVTNSVVVIATRKGNPKNLRDWQDLTKSGIDVITPNPFTSGGARWNIMAGYGAQSDKGANPQAGNDYLKALFKNVSVQDDSARKALQTFTTGKGDALLSYENDAIFAKQRHQPIDYTIPDATILIQNPAAVTSNSKHPQQAKAFLDFLYAKEAQRIFADNGYRPVVAGVAKPGEFPVPSKLFTIDDLGGWTAVTKNFFDPSTGVVTKIEQGNGVSTSSK